MKKKEKHMLDIEISLEFLLEKKHDVKESLFRTGFKAS